MDTAQIAQTLLLDPLNEATSLYQRYQQAPALRGYIQERKRFLVPIGALMVFISLGCSAASVLYLGGTRPVLVLLAMLFAPFVLVGSLFVQVYVFGSWLEGRALDRALRKDLGAYRHAIADLELIDYKVRILNGGTEAVTRVLIQRLAQTNRLLAHAVRGP